MVRKADAQFAEVATDEADDNLEVTPGIVVNNDYVSARIKGTWKMFWGRLVFDFEDGKRYQIPRDLYMYLKSNGNIYDTLA